MRSGLITTEESDFLYLEAKRIGWRSPQDFTYYLVDKMNEVKLYGEHLHLNLAQTSPILSEYLYRVTKDSEGDRDFYHKVIDFHATQVNNFLLWLYEDRHFRTVIQNIFYWKHCVDEFNIWKQSVKEHIEDYYFLSSYEWKDTPPLEFHEFCRHFVAMFSILRNSPYFFPFNQSGTLRIVTDLDNFRHFLYDPIRDRFLNNQQLSDVNKENYNDLSALKHHFYTLASIPTGPYFPYLNHELISLILQENCKKVFDEVPFPPSTLASYYALDSLKTKVSNLIFELNSNIKENLFSKYSLLNVEIEMETYIDSIKEFRISIPNPHANIDLPSPDFNDIFEIAEYIRDKHFGELRIKYCNIIFESTKDKTQFAITEK